MKCQSLASRVQQLEPDADAKYVARLCLLVCNSVNSMHDLEDDQSLRSAWRDASMKLQAAADQHAAMTEELEALARSDPEKFDNEQIWVLVRAIKVQSQILQLYLGEPALDV